MTKIPSAVVNYRWVITTKPAAVNCRWIFWSFTCVAKTYQMSEQQSSNINLRQLQVSYLGGLCIVIIVLASTRPLSLMYQLTPSVGWLLPTSSLTWQEQPRHKGDTFSDFGGYPNKSICPIKRHRIWTHTTHTCARAHTHPTQIPPSYQRHNIWRGLWEKRKKHGMINNHYRT